LSSAGTTNEASVNRHADDVSRPTTSLGDPPPHRQRDPASLREAHLRQLAVLDRGHRRTQLTPGTHDIVGMNVMDRFKAEVGQGELLTTRESARV
jgi:hypothetical protein